MKKTELLYYHYIDPASIESLHAQIGPVETSSTTEFGLEGALAGEGKVDSGFLSSLPMIPKAEFVGKTEGRFSRRKTTTLRTSLEGRLASLELHLYTTSRLWEYPGSSTTGPLKPTFAVISACFAISGMDLGNPNAKYWEFHADLPIGRVKMRTSVKRYRTSPAHLAEYWADDSGKTQEAELRIFGKLSENGNGRWYLKPLTIADIG